MLCLRQYPRDPGLNLQNVLEFFFFVFTLQQFHKGPPNSPSPRHLGPHSERASTFELHASAGRIRLRVHSEGELARNWADEFLPHHDELQLPFQGNLKKPGQDTAENGECRCQVRSRGGRLFHQGVMSDERRFVFLFKSLVYLMANKY